MHNKNILKTLILAKQAREKGNHPFGAILFLEDKPILQSENTVVTDNDVTCHAEMNLIRKASRIYEPEFLSLCTLYSSTEPCAMCCGAIYWSGIRKVVFGLNVCGLGYYTSGSFLAPCDEIFKFGKEKVKTIGPLLDSESKSVHRGFWKR